MYKKLLRSVLATGFAVAVFAAVAPGDISWTSGSAHNIAGDISWTSSPNGVARDISWTARTVPANSADA